MRKLALLRRSILRGDFSAAGDILRRSVASKPETPPPAALSDVCPGEDVSTGGDASPAAGPGRYWRVRRTLGQIAPDELPAGSELAAILRGARQRFDELAASRALLLASEARPDELLFVDLETCGLGGTPIFLVGWMAYEAGELVFTQCLARDYSEEAAICGAFAERIARARVLVTFNGKAFDMNMLRERSAFHGVRLPGREDEPPHLDLLHECRRHWRGELPNFRLQTLERAYCGRSRAGDIPGWAIPDAYHRFVRTGDARAIGDILHHNILDLLTMARLLAALLTGSGPAAE